MTIEQIIKRLQALNEEFLLIVEGVIEENYRLKELPPEEVEEYTKT